MTRIVLAPAILAVALTGAGVALAQNPPPVAQGVPPPPSAPPPSIQATRIAESEAPTIDGDLSDPIWAKGALIDHFYQIEPNNGAEPTDRTVARIAYDKDNLYISLYAHDSEPDKAIATIKTRDGGTYRDDNIRIIVDPGQTHRDAYDFEISVLGAYTDALIQNNSDFFQDWNTIWAHAAKRVADGWTAEIAIPFRSLSYDGASGDWGFDILRNLQHRNERSRWSYTPASISTTDLSIEGKITGLTGMDQGLGLDVQLYALSRYKQEWPKSDGTLAFEGSGNAFYKITPSLTGTLTVNTDFSDAPLDKRQVNTTRFSLFTPETRDFFLQDTAAFEFGGRSYYTGNRLSFGTAMSNGRPFFSRNIGLVRGIPVGVLGGAKISGDIGGISVGALTVRTADNGVAPGQQLSVVRLTAPVLAESQIGLIATDGDPTGLSRNTLGGVDFQYYNSNVLPGQRLTGDFYFQRSFSSTRGNDDEYGASITYPNEPVAAEVHFRHLGEDFVPALGFTNRVGVDEYRARGAYRERYRNSFLRWVEGGAKSTIVTNLSRQVESSEYVLYANASTSTGDQLTINLVRSYENIAKTFFLPGKVPVHPGQYEWVHIVPRLDSAVGRPFSVASELDCCTYYDGKYLKSDITLDWRISETFSLNFEQVTNLIDMPTGKVNVFIGLLDFAINFTPDMQLRSQVQYDNITQQFAGLARFRWEYEPGQEIFFSLGESSVLDGPFFTPHYAGRVTQALFRIGHTFQF